MSWDELLPPLRDPARYLYRVAEYNGLRPRVTSVYRSAQKQALLYERWLKGLQPYPVAPPGRSKHGERRAFDMVVSSPAGARALGELWQSWGGRWGGESDPVHFEA